MQADVAYKPKKVETKKPEPKAQIVKPELIEEKIEPETEIQVDEN